MSLADHGIEIIHGNALDLCALPNVAEILGSFGAVITDPPYSEHVHKSAMSHSLKDGDPRAAARKRATGRGVLQRDFGFAHLDEPLRALIAQACAHCSGWGVIYSDIESAHLWREACTERGAEYVRSIPWVRWSMPQLSGDRPPQGAELLTLVHGARDKGTRMAWNGPGNLTHLSHKCLRGEGKHKTEKPLDQALDLVAWFSNVGDTVFDPCLGSGTTALACAILGRKFVGFEQDEHWAKHAQERVERALQQELSDRDRERFARWHESQQTPKATCATILT